MLKCVRCGKCFTKKSDLTRHLRRMNACKVTDMSDMSEFSNYQEEKRNKSAKMFSCEFCSKSFSYKQSLDKHIKNPNNSCFVLKEIQPLKREVNSLKENPQTVINNTVNNIININLVAPGEESIDHITQAQVLELLKANNFDMVIYELMRLIYFNKEVPQNSHWCIAYPKDKYGALQYNNETAIIERLLTQRTINVHFQNMLALVAEKLGEIIKNRKLDINQLRNINQFYQYIGMDNIETEDSQAFEHVKMLAYNNRSVPIAVWKDLGIMGEHKNVGF